MSILDRPERPTYEPPPTGAYGCVASVIASLITVVCSAAFVIFLSLVVAWMVHLAAPLFPAF
jgi:hypothetical protein